MPLFLKNPKAVNGVALMIDTHDSVPKPKYDFIAKYKITAIRQKKVQK